MGIKKQRQDHLIPPKLKGWVEMSSLSNFFRVQILAFSGARQLIEKDGGQQQRLNWGLDARLRVDRAPWLRARVFL